VIATGCNKNSGGTPAVGSLRVGTNNTVTISEKEKKAAVAGVVYIFKGFKNSLAYEFQLTFTEEPTASKVYSLDAGSAGQLNMSYTDPQKNLYRDTNVGSVSVALSGNTLSMSGNNLRCISGTDSVAVVTFTATY
jgi:hypothetical protein